MRHAMAGRRRSGGGGRPGGGGGHHHHRPQQGRATVFDSNGPDVRIRGTAFQIVEKYQTLARDAASSGDRVMAESYLQHAEHYQRLINTWNEENPQPRFQNDSAPREAASSQAAEDGTGEQPDVVVTRRSVPKPAPSESDEDLALPASILGVSSDDQPSPRVAAAQ